MTPSDSRRTLCPCTECPCDSVLTIEDRSRCSQCRRGAHAPTSLAGYDAPILDALPSYEALRDLKAAERADRAFAHAVVALANKWADRTDR